MKKTIKSVLFVLFCLFPAVILSAERFGSLDSLFVRNDSLCFSFHETGGLDESLLKGVMRGTTVIIEYQVQLLDSRPVWSDRLVAEKRMRMKIHYDRWEQRFVLTRHNHDPELMDLESLHKSCSEFSDYALWPQTILEEEKQYIFLLRMVIQPMSMENLAEIRQWLEGEMDELNPKALKQTRSIGKQTGDWLLQLFVNVSGFGDRVIQVKSHPFHRTDDEIHFEDKKPEI